LGPAGKIRELTVDVRTAVVMRRLLFPFAMLFIASMSVVMQAMPGNPAAAGVAAWPPL